ncbi:hypothetical protein ES705_08113 [subsurface metagenome]
MIRLVGGDLLLPEKLEYIAKVQKFVNMLIESAKTDQITEADFYMIMKAKCKAMNKERRGRTLLLSKKAKKG